MQEVLLSLHQLCCVTLTGRKLVTDRRVTPLLPVALVGGLQGYTSASFPDISSSAATEPFLHLHNSEYWVPVNSNCCGVAREFKDWKFGGL